MKRYILILSVTLLIGCEKGGVNRPQSGKINYRQEMRNFVHKISGYGKSANSYFIIIPQNGQELITLNGEPDGSPVTDYIAAIDGAGREDLFYGYNEDNEPTPDDEKEYMLAFCDLCEQNNVEVLTIDYCSSHDRVDDSYTQNDLKGYISFAAPQRELNVIPNYPSQPFHVNNINVNTLATAQNFLYLINPENFSTKQDFMDAVSETNYDLIIMDCFFNDSAYSAAEIAQLKTKPNGGKRLVISYLSIGEAEDYRYYWQSDWSVHPPEWLENENPDWGGNYKVRYWYDDWQNIICGNDSSYLKKILDAGFDGVYLDIIDAFEYFEELENE